MTQSYFDAFYTDLFDKHNIMIGSEVYLHKKSCLILVLPRVTCKKQQLKTASRIRLFIINNHDCKQLFRRIIFYPVQFFSIFLFGFFIFIMQIFRFQVPQFCDVR